MTAQAERTQPSKKDQGRPPTKPTNKKKKKWKNQNAWERTRTVGGGAIRLATATGAAASDSRVATHVKTKRQRLKDSIEAAKTAAKAEKERRQSNRAAILEAYEKGGFVESDTSGNIKYVGQRRALVKTHSRTLANGKTITVAAGGMTKGTAVGALLLLFFFMFPAAASAQSSYADRYYQQYSCDPWERCHNALANHHGGPDTLMGAVSSLAGTIGIMPENGIYAQQGRYQQSSARRQSSPQYQPSAQYQQSQAPVPRYQPVRQYQQPQVQYQQALRYQSQVAVMPTLERMPVYEYVEPDYCAMVPTGHEKSNGEPILVMADPSRCDELKLQQTAPLEQVEPAKILIDTDGFPAVDGEPVEPEAQAESSSTGGTWGRLRGIISFVGTITIGVILLGVAMVGMSVWANWRNNPSRERQAETGKYGLGVMRPSARGAR